MQYKISLNDSNRVISIHSKMITEFLLCANIAEETRGNGD